ncbi:MAG: hypothetical protein BRC28_03595 [Nanohaloarchaea archaeon SW_4_43_9]|nr:MAG: hypothetical protein BRC28_03595 [Nanohaloarchaea archaeon SW_4_43_9]
MTEVYDTPWEMAKELLEDMGHSQSDINYLDKYRKADENSEGHLFPVLHLDEDGTYGVVLETSPDTNPGQFVGQYQSIRFEGELPDSYDLENEIEDIEKYRRDN